MACVAHLANHLAYDLREYLDGLHCRAEAVYQFPIAITIFLGGFFLGRGVVERSPQGKSFREVRSNNFDVVGPGSLDDQLDARGGRCCLSRRRYEENKCVRVLVFRVGRDRVSERRTGVQSTN